MPPPFPLIPPPLPASSRLYLLDEVDAALDEHNAARVGALLAQLAAGQEGGAGACQVLVSEQPARPSRHSRQPSCHPSLPVRLPSRVADRLPARQLADGGAEIATRLGAPHPSTPPSSQSSQCAHPRL